MTSASHQEARSSCILLTPYLQSLPGQEGTSAMRLLHKCTNAQMHDVCMYSPRYILFVLVILAWLMYIRSTQGLGLAMGDPWLAPRILAERVTPVTTQLGRPSRWRRRCDRVLTHLSGDAMLLRIISKLDTLQRWGARALDGCWVLLALSSPVGWLILRSISQSRPLFYY